MEWTLSTIIAANLIIVAGSILQMATGVSVGMIIVPFLAMISYTLVPAPIVFASLALTVMMAYRGRAHIDMKNMPQIGMGMVLGIFAALYILQHIHIEHLGGVFGLLILCSVIMSLKVTSFSLKPKLNYFGGFIAGTMGAMAAVGGQVLALLFQHHPLESIKATLAFLYTIFSVVMLTVFYLFGAFSHSQMLSGLYMMPGFIIGFLIAPLWTQYFNPAFAKPAVLLMATLGAIILIVKSLLT